jgi:hypothetical protein
MKLRHLFTVNIVIALFFGATSTIFPAFVFQLYGVSTNDAGNWTARLLGGSLLGFAMLMGFGRTAPNAEARRAIALALLVQDAVGFIASLIFQLQGDVNGFGWISAALYAVLALGYAYFLFLRPQDC